MIESSSTMSPRVLVAAPYPTTRAGLRVVAADSIGLTVAGEAADIESLIQQAEMLVPDVVLLDPGDDAEGWLQGLWHVADARTLPPVLYLSATTADFQEAIQVGVAGFLLRDVSAEEIGATVQALAHGLVVFDRRVIDLITTEVPPLPPPFQPADEPVDSLTMREREVLQLIAQGLPNKSIAVELQISEHTVKFHVGSILGKLGASSRAEALARAARAGLISL